MKKAIYNVIFAILSILCICLTVFVLNPKRPIEYRFDAINYDIGMKDFYILDTGNYAYIPDMYYFENHSGKTIEKIILNIKSENKDLFHLGSALILYYDEKYYPNLGGIRKINLSRSNKINIEVEYWFEGSKESAKFSEVIELNDIKKWR